MLRYEIPITIVIEVQETSEKGKELLAFSEADANFYMRTSVIVGLENSFALANDEEFYMSVERRMPVPNDGIIL